MTISTLKYHNIKMSLLKCDIKKEINNINQSLCKFHKIACNQLTGK